jgi:hypothetical protein
MGGKFGVKFALGGVEQGEQIQECVIGEVEERADVPVGDD